MLKRLGPAPSLAIVLGSGFQPILDSLTIEREITTRVLPGFPRMSVPGHQGRMVVARVSGLRVLFLAGRPHFYEGFTMDEVTFPVRLLAEYGVKSLLLTNAAGAIDPKFRPGDFMLVTDHINAMGVNPLRPCQSSADRLPAFQDLSAAYDPGMNHLLEITAKSAGIPLRQGVYIAVSGPSYETPAEIRAFRKWGAHAVGMSTVPEVIMARHIGLKVAAISCLTNMAAGMTRKPIDHKDVLDQGRRSGQKASQWLAHFVKLYGKETR